MSSPIVLVAVFFSLFISATFAQNNTIEPDITPQTQIEPLTAEEIAQQRKELEEAADQACAVCGGGILTVAVIFVIFIILSILLLVWVARDAKNRSMDNSVLWMLLVMFTNIIGLVIYLLSRPQGQLVKCSSCNEKRLATSAICPHCQNP